MKWIMCNDYMIMILMIIQFNNLFINILQSYLVISSKDYTPESWAVSCIGDTALSLLRPVDVVYYIQYHIVHVDHDDERWGRI